MSGPCCPEARRLPLMLFTLTRLPLSIRVWQARLNVTAAYDNGAAAAQAIDVAALRAGNATLRRVTPAVPPAPESCAHGHGLESTSRRLLSRLSVRLRLQARYCFSAPAEAADVRVHRLSPSRPICFCRQLFLMSTLTRLTTPFSHRWRADGMRRRRGDGVRFDVCC